MHYILFEVFPTTLKLHEVVFFISTLNRVSACNVDARTADPTGNQRLEQLSATCLLFWAHKIVCTFDGPRVEVNTW